MTLDNDLGDEQAGKTSEESREVKPGRVNEYKSGHRDAFSAAFNSAKDELEGEVEEKPKPKAKPKQEPKPAPKEEARKPEKKPEPKASEPEEAEDDEEEADSEDANPAVDHSKPLEAKKYWSEKRKEAFRFQPRDVQQQWLDADPEPSPRWPAEIQENFAKLPRDAKELVLGHLTESEKGITQKFQALAAERKLAEDIRNAVPPTIRGYMTQRGLSETQVFSKLLGYQQQAMTDPVGYVQQFIMANNLNPADILNGQSNQQGNPNGQRARQQTDVTSHPAFQALMAENQALKNQRHVEDTSRFESEFEGIIAEVDGDGNSLYPYLPLVADPMARIMNSDPEFFDSMGVKDRLATAYRMALEDYPELLHRHRTAKPRRNDDSDKAAHANEDEEQAAKLARAITPKSRTPQIPPKSAKTGDPFEDAFNWAKKKQSQR